MTTAYYHILDKIKEHLTNDVLVNTVTNGSLDDVDIKKQSIFPLAHVIINNARLGQYAMSFNISVIAMDIVDITAELTDNETDVLNTQLAILNRLAHSMLRGDLFDDKVQMIEDPNCEPFTERFENYMAGWTMTFDVSIPNDMTIC
jgi:hypothetical protein